MKRAVIVLAILLVAEIATAQSWTQLPALLHRRAEAAAVQLKDGNILVVGGRDEQGALTECELFDPRTNTWSVTGELNQARYRHDVQLLPTGEVIAIGGLTDLNVATTETCELYDPKSHTWQYTDPLPEASENIYAKVLPDGSIFASGGLDANIPQYVSFAVRYDPGTHTWTRLPDMLIALDGHNIFYSTAKKMTLVASGLYGGASGVFLKTTQILRDGAAAWEYGEDCAQVHDNTQQMAIQMPDETPVLCGGRVGTSSVGRSVEAYDFITERWSTIGTLVRPHWHCWAFRVGQDSIILVGGAVDPGPLQTVTAECTWFDYNTRTSTGAPAMLQARNLYAATKVILPLEEQCIHLESIYVFGGQDAGLGILGTCEKLDLGVRANPAVLSISPSTIDTLIGCHSLDTAVRIANSSCTDITIDSIVSADTTLSISANTPIVIAQADSTDIPLRIGFNRDSINTAIKIVLHSAAGREVRWVHIAGRISHGAVTLSSPRLAARSVCANDPDSIVLFNRTCYSASIENAWFEGPDVSYLSIASTPGGIPSDGFRTLYFNLAPITPRTYTATIVIATIANGVRDTLRQAISIQTTGGGAVVGRTVLNDRKVLSGDTVNVPIKLVTTAKSQALGAQIELSYDKDVLELLPPDFTGALADGGEDYDINLTSRGASLYIPGTIRIENGTVVNLRFRTFVAKNSCTTLKLSTLLFSPDDPKFTECVLSANLDSATICIEPQCGDNEIRDYMNGTGPRIMVIRGDHEAALQLHGWRLPTVEVYSILGERMPVDVTTQGEKVTISSDELPSGTYYARVSEGRVVRSIGFAVHR